jgi:hypothetical protein
MSEPTNSCSHEQLLENSSFSLQLKIEESTDSRSNSTLSNVLEGRKESRSVPSTQSSNPLKEKVLSSPSGGMKTPAERDADTTDVVIWAKQLSKTSLAPNKGCYPGNQGRCRRTWISNSPGKLIAYMWYGSEWAEEWLAETDKLRSDIIEKAGFKRTSILWLCDAWWTFDLLVLGKAGDIWNKLRGK